MPALTYPIALAIISLFVIGLEHFFPDREQTQLRKGLGWDFVHLVFNSHFLGVIFYGIAVTYFLPHIDAWIGAAGATERVYRNAAAAWPLWLQIIVAMVVVDFLQWSVHRALHRVPFLWEMHKCHHSVEDGEMDWIVSFRFQWTEVAVYRAVLYLPLAFFGFSPVAVMVHAIFGTLIGHLNHANLKITWGPFRYLLNSPKMHIWHHDYEGDTKTTKNFGIIFSTWDWIFGTAYMPDHPPEKIGYPGAETFPKNFFAAEAWPLQRWIPALRKPVLATLAGMIVIGAGWYLHQPPAAQVAPTPMFGESHASSQPAAAVVASATSYSSGPEAATLALDKFGIAAAADGFAHPEAMVSVGELAAALGAPDLVLLDVRPADRFEEGHIPSAIQIYRPDYSAAEPFPGFSRGSDELQRMLRERGVDDNTVVVAYTDGGPEAYRLWWTLRTVANYEIRVLDGGMQRWVSRGHGLAEGAGITPGSGAVTLAASDAPLMQRWSEVDAFRQANASAVLLDTREEEHFTGTEVSSRAARGGHIPGAVLLQWWKVVRDTDTDHRLASPASLNEMFADVGVTESTPVVTYCQSGTRSSATYFALHQLGRDSETFANYDGSWAEYSQLELPAAP